MIAYFKRRRHRVALRGAAAAGWTSSYVRDLIVGRQGVEPAISEVLYNGIPDAWVSRDPADLPAWEDRPMRIVTVSNVNHYKRQWLVIDALALLATREGLDGLTYHIAGAIDEGYRRELEARAEARGVGDRVRVEGRVSDERTVELFRDARAYVLMSVCESFGIPAVEAMSFGTPVVTANCCAMPEVCGEAADLVAVDDAEALAAHLAELLRSPKQAARLQQAGYANIQRFRWSAICERIAAVCERVA